MRVQAKIQKWGNSLGLRISGPMKAIPQFEENMLVHVDVSEEGIKVFPMKQPIKKLPFTEAQLLEGLNADTAHAADLASITTHEFGNE